VEKIVFSSALKEAAWKNSRIVDMDPAILVKELQQQTGGDILVMASGSIIKRLLRADSLDRLSISLCPEVAGGGARLFEGEMPSSSWGLRQSKATKSGALCLLYDRIRKGQQRKI
jgi:dihydrofolate reductase